MSCLYIPKKLKELPSSSKKAWNSITSTLSPKIRHLTKTTTHRFLDFRHNNKRHRTSSRGGFYYYKQYNNNYQHLQQPPYYSSEPTTPASVYVDRLFGESYSSTSKEATTGVTTEPSMTGGSSGGGTTGYDGGRKKKRKKVRHNNNNNNSNSNSNNADLKKYVASMPNIRGVDERAEEFISKFRQGMQIQREQSLIDFHEMLARRARLI